MKVFLLITLVLAAYAAAEKEVEFLEGSAKDFEGMTPAKDMRLLFSEEEFGHDVEMGSVVKVTGDCRNRARVSCKLESMKCDPPRRRRRVFKIIKIFDFGCEKFIFKITLACSRRGPGRRLARIIWRCIKRSVRRTCRLKFKPADCIAKSIDKCARGNPFMMITMTPHP